MKVRLRIAKNGTVLYEGDYDVDDSKSFGRACADACERLQQADLDRETSVGALMEHISDTVADRLNGALISVRKI